MLAARMKIFIMTDLEGVAGVLDFDNWCLPSSRYYDMAKELLTREVNAAIDGFFAAGATEIVVADGHGAGGINPLLLDPRAELMRYWAPPVYPFGLDKTYDAIAWVGQHAMSRTEFAHLAHTGLFYVFEFTFNGMAIGEFGQIALCASELGVPAIFGAGDKAFCEEASALAPGIETAAIKRGTTTGRGDECDAVQYGRRNLGAIHLHPERSRQAIRAGAEKALRRFRAQPFGPIPLKAPYELVEIRRHHDQSPKTSARAFHKSSVIDLMNLPLEHKPIKS
jgi:D-amino peptidase